jgi:hypothetical protein
MKNLLKNERVIEYVVILLVLIIFSKGILGGLFVGALFALLKTIYNKVSVTDRFISPLESLGLGSLAGLTNFVISLIF